MRTFIKTIRTITAVLMIIAGLLALFTVDNAQDAISLLLYAMTMIMGLSGGIYLLILTYPELTDLSEFEEADKRVFEEYEKELDELREHNLLLLTRYMTFKSIIISSNVVNDSNKDKFPNLYRLLYEEDLVCGGTKVKEGSLEQIDKVK